MNADKATFEQLKWAVQALASNADDQAQLFPSFACPACELLSDFDNWHRATVWRESLAITTEQREALQILHPQIDTMEQTPCFSMDVIRDREDWQRLRASAAQCVASFGWEHRLPPNERSAYV